MIVYIQPPNIYFEIAAYILAEGMYGCVTRYLVLYMRFWSTCLFFMKPSLPASPITRCPLPGSSGTRHVRCTGTSTNSEMRKAGNVI